MSTETLASYVQCNALQCDRSEAVADVMFFGVKPSPTVAADTLRALIAKQRGEFCEVNVFDGNEHTYIELGGWIGDQGLALKLIGLGSTLGLWNLLTPKSILGDLIPEELAQQMAGAGMVALQAPAQ